MPVSTCQFQSSCDFFFFSPRPPHPALLTVNETPFTNSKAHVNLLAFFVRKGNKRQQKDARLKKDRNGGGKGSPCRGVMARAHIFSGAFLFCMRATAGKRKKKIFWTVSRQQLIRRRRKLQFVKGKFVGHKTFSFCRHQVHFFTAFIFVVISMEERQ